MNSGLYALAGASATATAAACAKRLLGADDEGVEGVLRVQPADSCEVDGGRAADARRPRAPWAAVRGAGSRRLDNRHRNEVGIDAEGAEDVVAEHVRSASSRGALSWVRRTSRVSSFGTASSRVDTDQAQRLGQHDEGTLARVTRSSCPGCGPWRTRWSVDSSVLAERSPVKICRRSAAIAAAPLVEAGGPCHILPSIHSVIHSPWITCVPATCPGNSAPVRGRIEPTAADGQGMSWTLSAGWGQALSTAVIATTACGWVNGCDEICLPPTREKRPPVPHRGRPWRPCVQHRHVPYPAAGTPV